MRSLLKKMKFVSENWKKQKKTGPQSLHIWKVSDFKYKTSLTCVSLFIKKENLQQTSFIIVQ